MSVYMIFSFDVADPKEFASYVPAAFPFFQKYGAEILVADYAPQTLEGESRGVNIVLKFQSEEMALAFYNDPGYAPIRDIRWRATINKTATLAKEFIMK